MTNLTDEQKKEIDLLGRRVGKWADKGKRHEARVTPADYLTGFLEVGRENGFATHDDSWGEFEKEFAIMTRNLYVYRRMLEMLGELPEKHK